MMKHVILITMLFAGLFLSGCRKNVIRTGEILRRVSLRNTPEAVAMDFTAALSDGDIDRLCAMSTDRVRDMLYNELLLLYPDRSVEESLDIYSGRLKKNNGTKTFSGIILKESRDGKIAVYSVLEAEKEPVACSFLLVQDEHGNWKNDTRL